MRPTAPILIVPSIQHYAWGDRDFLPRLLGMDNRGLPWAEAWYGAHPSAPARACINGVETLLDEFIRSNAAAVLGAHVAEQFGELPYLLKVLACVKPLSIQVHPDREQARAGFAREEAAGIDRTAPHRSYRDPQHKPEVLVAWTEFFALAGFRRGPDLIAACELAPELFNLLPFVTDDAAGLRRLVEAYFALPDEVVQASLGALMQRLEREHGQQSFVRTQPQYWALRAHHELSSGGVVDRGLFFVFLLNLVVLQPGEAIFVPAGLLHAYLSGAGLELMANSDNVLRAGLTPKHVDVGELMRIVKFDAGAPPKLVATQTDDGCASRFPVPVDEFELCRVPVGSTAVQRTATGPETLIVAPPGAVMVVAGDFALRLEPGGACLIGTGTTYSLHAPDTPATVFVASTSDVAASIRPTSFLAAIERNIELARSLVARGEAPAVVGTVSGTAGAQMFWQRQLDAARVGLGARCVVSLHEDLPVNQALGLLLLWQRLGPLLEPGEGALVAFVFGEGTRATPFTEAECGQKPALASFVYDRQPNVRALSIVELALRTFAPVEAYLRRSGFDGIVVKWGDEVQIPTLDLSGADPRFAQADVVRFVSMRPMTDEDARNKDWVGVDAQGRVTGFIPRRPLAQMQRLAQQGRLQQRDGQLYGGINLGSIALSRALLDLLLDEFRLDINDTAADRATRPDLDPQLFTALCIAAMADEVEREQAWRQATSDSPAMAELVVNMPDVLDRLCRVLENFRVRHGRSVRMVAMDFGDQYWGDVGQHRQMHDFYMALVDPRLPGRIARALAGIEAEPDVRGNLIVGHTQLGADVEVSNSVLIDATIDSGRVTNSVLLGTHASQVIADRAFDVQSRAVSLQLSPRSGTYKVVSASPVYAGPGDRVTTVFLDDRHELLRVHEDTDLRDRACTYEVPILDNALSFSEAHLQVLAADPTRLEQQRTRAREKIE